VTGETQAVSGGLEADNVILNELYAGLHVEDEVWYRVRVLSRIISTPPLVRARSPLTAADSRQTIEPQVICVLIASMRDKPVGGAFPFRSGLVLTCH